MMEKEIEASKRLTAVVVDPYTSGAFYAPTFKAMDVKVVAVLTSKEPPIVYAESFIKTDFDQIIIAENDYENTVEQLIALDPVCIVAGCESGVELTDRLVTNVLPKYGNDMKLAKARRHKGDMGQAVIDAGLNAIKQICTGDEQEVSAWLKRENLENIDLVIKPAMSAGTDDVTRVVGGKGWQSIFNEMVGSTNKLGIVNEDVVIQEYVEGTEYVVDTFSFESKHSVANICEYRKKHNGDFIAVYDSMKWLEPDVEVYHVLVDYVRSVLDAVGLKFGTSHVEVMLTERGPKLIELGARPHGGGHPKFCRLATGDSQLDRAVRYYLSSEPIPMSYQLNNFLQVVFLISESRGYVGNAECLAQINQLDSFKTSTVSVKNGDYVEPTKDLFGSQCLGFIVLESNTEEQLNADYTKIRQLEKQLTFSVSI